MKMMEGIPSLAAVLLAVLIPWPGSSLAQVLSRHTLDGGGASTGIVISRDDRNVLYSSTDLDGVLKTTDAGEHWFPVNNNLPNGNISGIFLDPLDSDTLYAAAHVRSSRETWTTDVPAGELYRTRDGGSTWEVVYYEQKGGARCFSIASSPGNHAICIPYNASDPGAYDSDHDKLSDVIYIAAWDESTEHADCRGGVWKSVDEGATFTQMGLNKKLVFAVRYDPDNPETLYAGTLGDGLFASYDGGATWQDWSGKFPIRNITDILVVPNSDVIYVSTTTGVYVHSGTPQGVFKSVDNGNSFFQINAGMANSTLNFWTLHLDINDPSHQTVYAGTWPGDVPGKYQNGIYKTTNGGSTWVRMYFVTQSDHPWLKHPPGKMWEIAQSPDGRLYTACSRGCWRYEPSLNRWHIKAKGIGNICIHDMKFSPGNDSIAYLFMADSDPWKSDDGGETWAYLGDNFFTIDGVTRQNGGIKHSFAVCPTAPNTIYACGFTDKRPSKILNKSTDAGHSWTPIANGLPAGDWNARQLVVSAFDPNVAYLALSGEGPGVYKTTDGGNNWSLIKSIPHSIHAMAISHTAPETIVCGDQKGNIHIGTNNGTTWRTIAVAPIAVYSVDLFPTDPDYILAGLNVSGAYLSTDGGDNWTQIMTKNEIKSYADHLALSSYALDRYAATIKAIRFDPSNRNTIYLGADPSWSGPGILKSTDSGQSWTQIVEAGLGVETMYIDPSSSRMILSAKAIYLYEPRPDRPPATPTGFAAETISATQVRLTWNDVANETQYKIRWGLSSDALVNEVWLAANRTSWQHTGLPADTAYYYKVRAQNSVGNSGYTAPVSARTTLARNVPFTAYNDLAWGMGQSAANITILTREQQGLLVDYGSGKALPITLTLNGGGGPYLTQGRAANAGTDAASVFGGRVDCAGLISYATNALVLKLDGLSPTMVYELVVFGNRDNAGYVARTTIVTLAGADSFENASSAGATLSTSVAVDDTTTIGNGYNSVNGFVACYHAIDPGSDGQIELRVPGWSGTGGAGRYYLNALMLKAVPGEQQLVATGATWRYRKGTAQASSPAGAWRGTGFDDSAWSSGPAPFGYSSEAEEGPFGTELTDMKGAYSCVFLRRAFAVADPPAVSELKLLATYDDGFIAWINGREVARVNVTGAPGTAKAYDDQYAPVGPIEPQQTTLILSGASLPELQQNNVLAVQVFNYLRSSSDLVFEPELAAVESRLSTAADSDQDLLPDAWEAVALSDLSDPAELSDTGDPDGDGLSNIEEYVAGTTAQDPASYFAVDVSLGPSGPVVSFLTVQAAGEGYTGLTRHYQLQQRADLNGGGQWLPVAGCEDILATGNMFAHTAAQPADMLCFRAKVWLEAE